VLTRPEFQLAMVDTPGLHTGARRMLNQYMNRTAASSLADADLVAFVVEALRFDHEDERVLERIKSSGRPALLIVNKVDYAQPRSRLLPYLEAVGAFHPFLEVVPVSALKADDTARLAPLFARHLPESPQLFPPEQITDRSDLFLATEIIREKLMLRLQQELPYGLTVEIERTAETEDGRIEIGAVIWVERPTQKAIVIGEGGSLLKSVGQAARLDLNKLYGRRTHLELWVKVKENWADSANALHAFGYEGP
jgi:GTP-binding protein Era